MPPIIVDKEAKRTEILKAAQVIFARKGFHKATIAAIAVEAGIGKGTVYEYFPDKRELFRGCIKLLFDEVQDEGESGLAGSTDPETMIRNYIRSIFRGYLKRSDRMELLLIFWAEAVQNNEEIWRDLTLEVYQRVGDWFEEVIDRGVESGIFRPVDAGSIAQILVAAIDGLAFQWVMYRDKFDVEGVGEKLAEMAIYLLQSNRKRALFPFVW